MPPTEETLHEETSEERLDDALTGTGYLGVGWRRLFGPFKRQLRRHRSFLDVLAIVLVTIIILTAIIGPFFAPDVYHSNIKEAMQPPSSAHWLGTDDQGRDVMWRIVCGARETLGAVVLVVVGYSLIGVTIATVASVGPKWLGEGLMRITDLGLAFPSLVFALGIAAVLGASLRSSIIALWVTGWPMTARLLRGIMRETMSMPFVEGARVLGVSRFRLMVRHVLPNALPPLFVKWAGDVGNTVLAIGALSFIGAGAQPPSAEWGAMVNAARTIMGTAWWAAFFPGLAIAITTAAFGLFGDMIHMRSNPELRAKLAGAGR